MKDVKTEMVIPFRQLISKVQRERFYWSFCNESNIETKDISVIMLCILFHNKKISRERFVARMKQYDVLAKNSSSPMICRRLGTYKSEILDRWYNDTSLTAVYVDEVVETCNSTDLKIEDYLKYLNIGFNRNRNYCVDYIAFNIFKKIIHHWDKNWAYDFLTRCGLKDLNLSYISFEEADRRYDLSFGYCCDDCDGCLRQYKESRYHFLYEKDSEGELRNAFKDAFLSMKTHLKNPKEKLTTLF